MRPWSGGTRMDTGMGPAHFLLFPSAASRMQEVAEIRMKYPNKIPVRPRPPPSVPSKAGAAPAKGFGAPFCTPQHLLPAAGGCGALPEGEDFAPLDQDQVFGVPGPAPVPVCGHLAVSGGSQDKEGGFHSLGSGQKPSLGPRNQLGMAAPLAAPVGKGLVGV